MELGIHLSINDLSNALKNFAHQKLDNGFKLYEIGGLNLFKLYDENKSIKDGDLFYINNKFVFILLKK